MFFKSKLLYFLTGYFLPYSLLMYSIDYEKTFNDLLSVSEQIPLEQIHGFNAQEREKWVKEKAATLTPGSLVLDVGAGTGRYREYFSHCIYKTHDFAENTNHVKYTKLDYVSDIINIPVEANTFDVVLCTEVLEHVPYPIDALAEMARIVKPSGRLLITAPLGSGLHQLPYHFYGGYTPEWYKYFAKKFNLSVVEITENGGFFKLLAQECARVAWTFDSHKKLHGEHAEFVRWIFNDVLPRYFFSLDKKHFHNQFTVGYHVELIKKD